MRRALPTARVQMSVTISEVAKHYVPCNVGTRGPATIPPNGAKHEVNARRRIERAEQAASGIPSAAAASRHDDLRGVGCPHRPRFRLMCPRPPHACRTPRTATGRCLGVRLSFPLQGILQQRSLAAHQSLASHELSTFCCKTMPNEPSSGFAEDCVNEFFRLGRRSRRQRPCG